MENSNEQVINQNQQTGEIKFFSMPLKRFYLLCVCTFGIYEIYWFYRNWKAVQIAEQSKIRPFWRAVLVIFFAIPLFEKVKASVQKHGYKESFSPRGLAVTYLVLLIVSNVIVRYQDYNTWLSVGSIVLLLLSALMLLPIQKAINFNNKHVPGGDAPRERTTAETVIIIVGVIIAILAIVGSFASDPKDNKATKKPTHSQTLTNQPAPKPTLSPEIQAAKTKKDALTAQYEKCHADLAAKELDLDSYSEAQLAQYDAEGAACDKIRDEQSAAVKRYNDLVTR